MTAPPQIITRALTFSFAPSVSATTGLPEIMEVAVLPLGDASSASAGGTFAGGVKTATVELVSPGPNVAEFDLIPSYSPGLSAPILYRVLWRAGVMGRTFSYDFAMPDADVDFEAVISEGLVIDGEVYLQHSDLGVPGRVARLNEQGIPTDSSGNPVATLDEIAVVTNEITVERVQRLEADANLLEYLGGTIQTQDAATLNTAKVYTDNKISTVNGALGTETAQRTTADTTLQTQFNTRANGLQGQIDQLVSTTGATTDALEDKADLDETGHVAVSQIPPAAFTTAIPVPNQAAMLALPPSVAQQGDLAVRPDSVWLLNANDPSVLSNWIDLTNINSVNGKRGVVVLTAADVGAIPTGGSVDMNQVTGLNTALLNKTDATTTTALQTQVTNLAGDPTTVHTVGGTIPLPPMPPEIALVNAAGQVTNKIGQVVAAGGAGGAGAVLSVNTKTGNVVLNLNDVGGSGQIAMPRVTGLDTALAGKAATTDTRFTDARTPTAHAASHGAGQPDAITVAQSQVSGLSALFSNNNLTPTSNHGNRINALETAVAGGGGGGEGGGTPAKATWWDSPADTLDFATVTLKGPFGKDADDGHLYYDPDGAAEAEAVFPHITSNGHLVLRQRNEANPPDPVMASQADLDATNTAVAGKANQSALTALSATVDTKAAIADLNATNTAVGTKANQSALDSTNAQLVSKANQSALDATNTAVAAKAEAGALATTNANVSALQAAMPAKANLSGGKVPVAELPDLPQSKITGLATTLTGKADLVGGTVPLTQLPNNIPASKIVGVEATLTNKADLVGGRVPVGQIPPEAITTAAPVANLAAMLALTPAQVQPGDFAIISGTANQGSYLLTAPDPSHLENWQPLSGASAPVVSVNDKTGAVVLTWTDVGAMAANAAIPISQVTNLQPTLNTFATTAALTAGLAPKTSFADVQNMFYTSSMVKRADYVATTSVASRAGRQSADGVLMPVGATVLLTAQPSSVDNGLWIVNSPGAWTRAADFATGSWLARDSVVVIANQTGSASGSANPNTIWQMTVASGFIDTAVNNWARIGWTAPPFAPLAGNGVVLTGTYPALTIAAKVNPGEGLVNTATGLAVDNNQVGRKFLGTVPAGNKIAAITHNLNTTSPVVQIWDTGSNIMVLAGVTVTSPNSISIEFASVPGTGDYRVCVLG